MREAGATYQRYLQIFNMDPVDLSKMEGVEKAVANRYDLWKTLADFSTLAQVRGDLPARARSSPSSLSLCTSSFPFFVLYILILPSSPSPFLPGVDGGPHPGRVWPAAAEPGGHPVRGRRLQHQVINGAAVAAKRTTKGATSQCWRAAEMRATASDPVLRRKWGSCSRAGDKDVACGAFVSFVHPFTCPSFARCCRQVLPPGARQQGGPGGRAAAQGERCRLAAATAAVGRGWRPGSGARRTCLYLHSQYRYTGRGCPRV